MGFINKIKFKLIGTYIWLRIKYLSYKYKIPYYKIHYAYINLYFSFKNVIMILDRCKYEGKYFCIEVRRAIKAKELIEESALK